MCFSQPKVNSNSITEQLNKNNAVLSNEKTAKTTTEKTGNKRTMTSLRVPIKKSNNTTNTGMNTTDTTATGLNIPV